MVVSIRIGHKLYVLKCVVDGDRILFMCCVGQTFFHTHTHTHTHTKRKIGGRIFEPHSIKLLV